MCDSVLLPTPPDYADAQAFAQYHAARVAAGEETPAIDIPFRRLPESHIIFGEDLTDQTQDPAH